MNISKQEHRKLLFTAITIATFVLSSVVVYFLLTKNNQVKNLDNTKEAAKEQTSASTPKANNESPDLSDAGANISEKTPKQYEESTTTTNNEILTGVINFRSVSGDNLVIRTTINQLLSTGTCELTMTKGDRVVTETANIVDSPTSSTCSGFDVPLSKLESGEWSISIKIQSNDKTGTLTDKVAI